MIVDGTGPYFYADDTVIFCTGSFCKEAVAKLQAVFNIIQTPITLR